MILKKPWTTQPPPDVPIDWENPINDGLVCFVDGYGDRITGLQPTIIRGSPTIGHAEAAHGVSGRGFIFPASTAFKLDFAQAANDQGRLFYGRNALAGATQLTFMHFADETGLDTWHGPAHFWIGVRQAPYGFGISRNNLTANAYFRLKGSTANIEGAVTNGWGSAASVVSGPHTRAFTHKNNESLFYFLDGKQIGGNHSSADLGVYAMNLGGSSSGELILGDFRLDAAEDDWIGTLLLVPVWNKAKTYEQVRSMGYNPWQGFVKLKIRTKAPAATGAILASPALVISAIADLKARGKLDAAPALVISLLANLKAKGNLDAAPALAISATADLKAKGKLDAIPELAFIGVAGLNAKGKLDAIPALAFTAAADLKADGKLDAVAPLVFSLAANLVDITGGSISAVAPLIFTGAADLKALGKLDAAAALAFTVAANLKAKGKLDAAAALAFTAAADLKADGKLDAAAALVFSLVANLLNGTGVSSISATPALAFSVLATLTARGKLDAAPALALALAPPLLTDATPPVEAGFSGRHIAAFWN